MTNNNPLRPSSKRDAAEALPRGFNIYIPATASGFTVRGCGFRWIGGKASAGRVLLEHVSERRLPWH